MRASQNDLTLVAHAVGICYCSDGGCYPGPVDEIVKAANKAQAAEGEAAELEAKLTALNDIHAKAMEAGKADRDRLERLAAQATIDKERAERERDEDAAKLAVVGQTARDLDAELAEANRKLAVVNIGTEGAWRWMGDGSDEPGSLSCPVVMSADTLRGMLAKGTGDSGASR